VRKHLAAGAQRAGRDASRVDIAAYVLSCVTDNRDEARTLARQHIAYYVGGMGTFYAELMTRYGWGEIAERVQARWKEGDRTAAAALISDEIVDELAITGAPDECRARLRRYQEQGVALPILAPPHGATGPMIARTIRELAPARLG
jgi:alkanesulfonate monooxygenase SsuD/methylene tetrahydromethanopterin reductase-like flavin-dependent oxidoreductase (luciferase family)